MFGSRKKESKIKVMVNGLPGKMAANVAEHVLKADDLELIGYSLTGQNIGDPIAMFGGKMIELIKPDKREQAIKEFKKKYKRFISVDFVKDPNNPNLPYDQADFYCRHSLPFVMGSVGGKRDTPGADNSDTIEQRVRDSGIVAVIAPNMAKQIVALQELLLSHSNAYPSSLDNYRLQITESHQKAKGKETSGTAKAMVKYFNALGIGFSVDQITKIRDPEEQLKLGVPKEYLDAHGWHIYTLTPTSKDHISSIEKLADSVSDFLLNSDVFKEYTKSRSELGGAIIIDRKSPDKTVHFKAAIKLDEGGLQVKHYVNGRDIYGLGGVDGVRFADKKDKAGEKGKAYSMIPVSKGE
jgi:4-hydroxy-tetrahydrodipicolinate reductase